ncbi:MAG: RT0821/Lpp0805 family surface protein [Actinomycetota bacterium]
MKTTSTTKLLPLAVAASLLAACSQDTGVKQTGGAILGGIGGGLAGAQFGKGTGNLAATAIGTLLGAYLGSEVGKSLDRADQTAMNKATDTAHTAPVGQSISWNNPDSGHSGTVTPVRDGTDKATGAYCREYQTTVNVGGKTEQAYGTACRQPDGSWKVVQ